MAAKKTRSDSGELEHILSEARKMRVRRGNLYRDRALKLLPWLCAWCGRDFTSKKLHELTVHHKDHDHDNNPPDGSNWELLCMYCHDSEHSRSFDGDASDAAAHDDRRKPGNLQSFRRPKRTQTEKITTNYFREQGNGANLVKRRGIAGRTAV